MNKIKDILKSKLFLIPLIAFILFLVPSAFAYYFSSVDPNMTTNFKMEYDAIFARAYIITYWEDIETGEIAAKSSWTLKDNINNDNWTKIDDYYYFNGVFNESDIISGVPTDSLLIDENLTAEDLSNDDLTQLKYVARYKVVYEFLEADAIDSRLSCEVAWNITYSSEWIPSKI